MEKNYHVQKNVLSPMYNQPHGNDADIGIFAGDCPGAFTEVLILPAVYRVEVDNYGNIQWTPKTGQYVKIKYNSPETRKGTF